MREAHTLMPGSAISGKPIHRPEYTLNAELYSLFVTGYDPTAAALSSQAAPHTRLQPVTISYTVSGGVPENVT